MITSKMLLDDLMRWGLEHTGREPSVSCFGRAFDEVKSLVLLLESERDELKAKLLSSETKLEVLKPKLADCESALFKAEATLAEMEAYAFYTAAGDIRIWWSAKSYDIYSAKDWAKANKVDYSDLVSLYDHSPVTANKAEVPDDAIRLDWMAQKQAFIGWGSDGEKCAVYSRGDEANELNRLNQHKSFREPRDAIDHAMSLHTLPPLKDVEKCQNI